jgi:hypothetical protein
VLTAAHTVTVEVPPLYTGQVVIPPPVVERLPEGARAALSRMTRAVVIFPELAEPPEVLADLFRRKGGKPLLGCIIYDSQGTPVAWSALVRKGKYVESWYDAENKDALVAAGTVTLAVMSLLLQGMGFSKEEVALVALAAALSGSISISSRLNRRLQGKRKRTV